MHFASTTRSLFISLNIIQPSDETTEITVESVKPRIEEVPSLSTPASPEKSVSELNASVPYFSFCVR